MNTTLTKEQVKEAVSNTKWYTVDSDWDGNMDTIPLLYPNPYNPWTSARAYTNGELVQKYFMETHNPLIHPCG